MSQRAAHNALQGLIRAAVEMFKMPPAERTQEHIHLCAVMLTDHLRAISSKVPYNLLCDVCRALTYTSLAPRVRINDSDEVGQTVLRIVLSGSVLVQRRFGPKSWLPVTFMRAGDILGLPSMLESSPDDIRYTTLGDAATGGCEFAVLRRFEFERCLRSTYELAIRDNVKLLQRTPSFSALPESTLKQLVTCSRLVALGAGELLTREGEAADELFVLKSGAVRLVKSLRTRETVRWPTEKRPQSLSRATPRDLHRAIRTAQDYSSRGGGGFPGLGKPGRRDSNLAIGASSRRGSTPAIRRNVTSFCMTAVHAIAMSPILFMLFVGHELLPAFIKSFGPARSPAELDQQLRQQRAWQRYKQECIFHATNRPVTRLQMVVGPRRGPSGMLDERDGGYADKPGSAGGGGAPHPPTSPRGPRPLSHSARARAPLLDGLHKEVNGAASSELANASADMGTTITEEFTQRNYLEPTRTPAKGASVKGQAAPGELGVISAAMRSAHAQQLHRTVTYRRASVQPLGDDEQAAARRGRGGLTPQDHLAP